jgi:hypothetical protein
LTQRYHEIQDNKGDDTPGDKKDIAAIYDVVKQRAKSSNYLKNYLNTKEAKKISGFIQ